jgi:hypothetical protein
LPCGCSFPSVVQLSAPQLTVPLFAKPAQLVRVLPSHAAFAQSRSPSASHAVRPPCGLPVTGVHAPALPTTSHASHCPSHAWLQQTPSMQCPLAHSVPVEHDVALLLKQLPGDWLVRPPHAAPVPQPFTEQQTPSVQKPDAHWSPAVQVLPTASVGTHDPDEQ